jgi:hypothetical protein
MAVAPFDAAQELYHVLPRGFLAGECEEESGQVRGQFLIFENVVGDAAGIHGGVLEEAEPVVRGSRGAASRFMETACPVQRNGQASPFTNSCQGMARTPGATACEAGSTRAGRCTKVISALPRGPGWPRQADANRCQVGLVEHLPMPAGDQGQKAPEHRQIVDRADTSHAPFQVGQQDGSWLSAAGAAAGTSCRNAGGRSEPPLESLLRRQ